MSWKGRKRARDTEAEMKKERHKCTTTPTLTRTQPPTHPPTHTHEMETTKKSFRNSTFLKPKVPDGIGG